MGLPDLRLIPSCIGGNPKKRTGIITAASIPAKKLGIKTAEPVAMALRKCPDLVIVPGDFDLYVKCSRAFKAICKEYSPAMESFSIDEVFLDMTGMELLYPDPIKTATEIKDRIRDELGFTANVGIGRCKVCAKMASDFEKPDKVHTLYPEEIETKMWPLSIEDLFTCGKSTAARLRTNGIRTIGDLARFDLNALRHILGEKQSIHLHNYANGIDESPVLEEREDAKGYSAETTVEEDLTEFDEIEHILLAQSDVVAARIRRDEVKCRCVAIKYKTSDFASHSHQKKLFESTDVTEVIYATACELLRECYHNEPVRLVGISLTDIDRDSFEQMSLIVDERKEKMKKLDMAMDSIRGRYGNESVRRASTVDVDRKINRRHKAESGG